MRNYLGKDTSTLWKLLMLWLVVQYLEKMLSVIVALGKVERAKLPTETYVKPYKFHKLIKRLLIPSLVPSRPRVRSREGRLVTLVYILGPGSAH